jgi:alkanesulfonate monooxygenase SsuD/methylene tetrahydromethanopterin reductase-like flavin-dependent oxidoreductase (luciferase family)
MKAMRIGILISTRGVVMESSRRPAVETCWTMARLADQAGYDAVWVGDSIVAKPRLEAVTTLAYLAGITERTRLGTAVLLPALRHPVVLAHQIANVDQISEGRVVLGLGVGWSLPSAEREWAACGADHKRRVRRLEEHVRLWRMLWHGEPVTYQGDGIDLVDHTIGPLPWRAEGPPVLITAANRGEMLPAQFDRFARLGDGIITTYLHAEECRLVRERAEEALARHHRAFPGFSLCVYTTVRMEDDPRAAERISTEFLETYYGGGVHSRGNDGPRPGRRGGLRAPALCGRGGHRSVHPVRRRRSARAARAVHRRRAAPAPRLTTASRRTAGRCARQSPATRDERRDPTWH